MELATNIDRMCLEAYFSEKCGIDFEDVEDLDSEDDDDMLGEGDDQGVQELPPS